MQVCPVFGLAHHHYRHDDTADRASPVVRICKIKLKKSDRSIDMALPPSRGHICSTRYVRYTCSAGPAGLPLYGFMASLSGFSRVPVVVLDMQLSSPMCNAKRVFFLGPATVWDIHVYVWDWVVGLGMRWCAKYSHVGMGYVRINLNSQKMPKWIFVLFLLSLLLVGSARIDMVCVSELQFCCCWCCCPEDRDRVLGSG